MDGLVVLMNSCNRREVMKLLSLLPKYRNVLRDAAVHLFFMQTLVDIPVSSNCFLH